MEGFRLKIKKIFFVFLVITMLISCAPKTDEDIFYETQKLFNKMETYYCEVEITSRGNKDPQRYLMSQWFKKPNKYKFEVLEPENLKGKITVSNGKKAWEYHPVIDQVWMIENFVNSEEQNMFLGYFIKNCLNSEDVEIRRKTVSGVEYLIIDTNIPGNHVYFDKERLWIHVKSMKPYLLQVFDAKEQIRIDVKYLQFEYNPKLEDHIFQLTK